LKCSFASFARQNINPPFAIASGLTAARFPTRPGVDDDEFIVASSNLRPSEPAERERFVGMSVRGSNLVFRACIVLTGHKP
jgi:hypothetical protein